MRPDAFGDETHLGCNSTIPVAVLELDHMGHLGWSREKFLFDDMHPQFAFNNAVSNILLNALAPL